MPASRRRARSSRLPTPPDAITSHDDGARELRGDLDVRADVQAVARDVGVEQRGGAPARGALAELDRGDVAARGPAVDGDDAIARVDRDDDLRRGVRGTLPRRARASEPPRCRARRTTRRARSRVSIAARSRMPPPTSTGSGDAATISRISSVCCGEPANAPSRSTTCRRSAPPRASSATSCGGSIVEHGRAIAPAFLEAHGLAAEQIDRGIELHAASTNARSSARPTPWLFSGWN